MHENNKWNQKWSEQEVSKNEKSYVPKLTFCAISNVPNVIGSTLLMQT